MRREKRNHFCNAAQTCAVLAVALVYIVLAGQSVLICVNLTVVHRDVASIAAAEVWALGSLEALGVLTAATIVDLARVDDCEMLVIMDE